MFAPFAVSFLAIGITLIYASFRDIRERRVPFPTWYPMLAVGIPASAWYFWDSGGGAGPFTGFLALAGVLLYALYLDTTDTKTEFRPLYLVVVLVVPALAWLVLPGVLRLDLLLLWCLLAACLSYATFLDLRERATIFRIWYPAPVTGIVVAATAILVSSGAWQPAALVIGIAAVFCLVFYIFVALHFFGGADGWALIFIALCLPVFPIVPLWGYPPLQFLPFTVLANAVILNLAVPLAIFLSNLVRGNRAPFPYTFFGFPVQGDRIAGTYGFVMEEIADRDGVLERRFVGIGASLKRMVAGGPRRMYTKDLREHPEQYRSELELYRRAGSVWISYAVPFIVPIAAGFLTAVIVGDILFTVMLALGVV
jgi:preflagellin peptidase FlaK